MVHADDGRAAETPAPASIGHETSHDDLNRRNTVHVPYQSSLLGQGYGTTPEGRRQTNDQAVDGVIDAQDDLVAEARSTQDGPSRHGNEGMASTLSDLPTENRAEHDGHGTGKYGLGMSLSQLGSLSWTSGRFHGTAATSLHRVRAVVSDLVDMSLAPLNDVSSNIKRRKSREHG